MKLFLSLAVAAIVVTAQADPVTEADSLFSSVFSEATPGCSVQVRANRQIVYENGFGMAKLESPPLPNKTRTRFRLASVSKQFVAMGILKLRDEWLAKRQGDLLDKKLGALFADLAPSYAAITVRQLLNHTAGIVREAPDSMDPPNDFGFLKHLLPPSPTLLESTPGTQWSYSNVAYFLAAGVLQTASGRDWREYLTREIFQPMQLEATSVENAQPLQDKGLVARGYDEMRGEFSYVDLKERKKWLASGGVISTAADLGRVAAATEQQKVLSKDSWRQLITATPLAAQSGERDPYALGWYVDSEDPALVRRRSHSGGGLGAKTWFEQREGCGSAAVLCNYGEAFPDFKLREVAARLFQIFCR